MYLLLTLFWECCKRVGKYCAIVGVKKFAFYSPTTKKLPLLKRLWTYLRTRSFPICLSSTQFFCLQKEEKFSFPHTHVPQIWGDMESQIMWFENHRNDRLFHEISNLIMAKIILYTEPPRWKVLLVLSTFSFSHF